jgi:peptide/nickel transport system ATP-binding protein
VQPTRCRDEAPPLREVLPAHTVACHWAEDIRAGRIQPREREPIFEPGPDLEPVAEPPPT